jgi:hypothetical protein
MKVHILSVLLIITISLTGCNEIQGNATTKLPDVPTSTQLDLGVMTTLSPTKNVAFTETATPVKVSTGTPPPESRLRHQCVEVTPELTSNASYNGTLLLKDRKGDNNKPYVTAFDISTGEIAQYSLENENQINHAVSPDRTMIAYNSIVFDKNNNIAKDDLVIADENGLRLKSIPWEEGWGTIPVWLDDKHIIINLASLDPEQNIGQKPATMLVLNPFTDEREILSVNYPDYIDTPGMLVPYWEGWSGAVYDSTGTLAIYPSFFESDNEKYTYAVWDLSKNQTVASLENIFAPYLGFNDIFPIPRWSPDNSHFIFNGLVNIEGKVFIELYGVSQDGRINQMTHLSPIAYVLNSSYSWSPNGRYVALFLINKDIYYPKALVALLDTVTLEVTDYCLPITFVGGGYGLSKLHLPIWSPDSKGFLIVDWYEKEHSRTILIDIDRGTATQIAKDVEPLAWMDNP